VTRGVGRRRITPIERGIKTMPAKKAAKKKTAKKAAKKK
jgi:hypothetical protein